MADVAFLEGQDREYSKLSTKNPYTFYKTEKNLYLGERPLCNDVYVKKNDEQVPDWAKVIIEIDDDKDTKILQEWGEF